MGYLSREDIYSVAQGLVSFWCMMRSVHQQLSSWCESLLHTALCISPDPVDNRYSMAYAPYQDSVS